jgi:hypothetical protein
MSSYLLHASLRMRDFVHDSLLTKIVISVKERERERERDAEFEPEMKWIFHA